ncbi:hypothetical protein BCR32DRAFT_250760 [Anaeromyces robustus]|uniref:Peptidase S8/S53 domain-containing protein n=1 Tax=Anaeromyces robustus TaxID=1754192 RepID=A0A1Y1VV29_9FUNG|nr:hypothetical protein BCR32DRAFT_250760 [Anaeromyces robustus]|eukprot:ORX65137.1 hypothetical protein BCR32DRAFT_250760 [Anaeromyces robustus]
MNNYFLLFKVILILNCFIGVYTENTKNEKYMIAILRKKSDNNYYDESPTIQDKIDDFVNDKMNEIYNIIEENKDSYILSNGKQDEKLKELDSVLLEKRSDLNITKKISFINKFGRKNSKYSPDNLSSNYSKRSKDSMVEYIPFESKLVNHICPIKNFYAISVYLSLKTKEIICHLSHVIYCRKVEKIDIPVIDPQNENNNSTNVTDTIDTIDTINTIDIDDTTEAVDIINDTVDTNDTTEAVDINDSIYTTDTFDINDTTEAVDINDDNENNSTIYYDIDAIKRETNWSDVSVQEISYNPNHLALLSQGAFPNLNKLRDTNYYYPSSAGEGIDIYLIDSGLDINHEDFYKNEKINGNRTITCDAIFTEDNSHYTSGEEKYKCNGIESRNEFPNHGILVSSLAGGNLYGVAKKANIHMIAIDFTGDDALRSFDYILQHGKPHKTIISMSFASYQKYDPFMDAKLDELINNGIIIFSGAANDSRNCCAHKNEDGFMLFSSYRKTITVGAATINKNSNGYIKVDYSNFGDCVDIFAPCEGYFPYLEEGSTTDVRNISGTSSSTPIAAGIAALIMSEHPEIKFDNELMRKTLIEMSVKNAIDFITIPSYEYPHDTPNRFINNGKKRIFYKNDFNIHCGGKTHRTCSDGECCTKDGECISLENHPGDQCFIENGCQSEFGYCTSIEKSIEDCENELNENNECLFESEEKDISKNQCFIINSSKCQKFYYNQLSDQSICSIAKKYNNNKDNNNNNNNNNNNKFKFINNFNMKLLNEIMNNCPEYLMKYKNECLEYINVNYNECFIRQSLGISNDNLILYDIDSLIDQCNTIKRDKCMKFYKNAKEEILNNSSCSNLYEKGGLNILSILHLIEEEDENVINNTFSTIMEYDEYNEKCDSLIEQRSLIVDCYNEINNYNNCILNKEYYDNGNNDNDDDNDDDDDEDDDTYRFTNDELKQNYSFIKQCIYVKTDNCMKFYKNSTEAILNIPSCSTLYENGNTSVLDLTSILNGNEEDDIKNTFKIYMGFNEKCDSLLEKDSMMENCNKELEEYKECFLDTLTITNTTTTNEIFEKCNIIYNDKCREFYFAYDYQLKNCNYVHHQFKKIDILENAEEIINFYDNICEFNPSNELKENIKYNCKEMLLNLNDECLFEYYPGMNNDELVKKCEIFESEKCQKTKSKVINSGTCNLVNSYSNLDDNDEDDENSIIIKKYKTRKLKNENICESLRDDRVKQYYIDNCEYSLTEYENCNLNEKPFNDDDLNYKCNQFLNCQEFYDNPSMYIDEDCDIAQVFKNIEIFDKSSENYNFYKDICPLN